MTDSKPVDLLDRTVFAKVLSFDKKKGTMVVKVLAAGSTYHYEGDPKEMQKAYDQLTKYNQGRGMAILRKSAKVVKKEGKSSGPLALLSDSIAGVEWGLSEGSEFSLDHPGELWVNNHRIHSPARGRIVSVKEDGLVFELVGSAHSNQYSFEWDEIVAFLPYNQELNEAHYNLVSFKFVDHLSRGRFVAALVRAYSMSGVVPICSAGMVCTVNVGGDFLLSGGAEGSLGAINHLAAAFGGSKVQMASEWASTSSYRLYQAEAEAGAGSKEKGTRGSTTPPEAKSDSAIDLENVEDTEDLRARISKLSKQQKFDELEIALLTGSGNLIDQKLKKLIPEYRLSDNPQDILKIDMEQLDELLFHVSLMRLKVRPKRQSKGAGSSTVPDGNARQYFRTGTSY